MLSPPFCGCSKYSPQRINITEWSSDQQNACLSVELVQPVRAYCCLYRMYPLIVSMDMLSFWHNQVQRGCTVDWPSERHFQLHDQDLRAARAHSGASGAFGGFGGGSSAGGAGAGGSW